MRIEFNDQYWDGSGFSDNGVEYEEEDLPVMLGDEWVRENNGFNIIYFNEVTGDIAITVED